MWIQDYQILESQKIRERFIYRVENREGKRFCLIESVDYWGSALRWLLYKERLPALLETYFYALQDAFFIPYQQIRHLYSLHDERLWETLKHPFSQELEAGMLTDQQLGELWSCITRILSALKQAGLAHPGLILPLLYREPDTGRLVFIEWEHCVPVDETVVYPHLYLGYHTDYPWMQAQRGKGSYNQMLMQQALGASWMEALLCKPAALWYPERIRPEPYRALFQGDYYLALNRFWHEEPNLAHLPAPAGVVFSSERRQTYAQANRAYWQALQAFEAKNMPVAEHYLIEAEAIYLNDPLMYLLHAEVAKPEADIFQLQIVKGLRCANLANLNYLRAQHSMEHGRFLAAIPDLQNAIQTSQHFPEGFFALGKCYEQLGNLYEAEKNYALAVRQRQSGKYKAHLLRVAEARGTVSDYAALKNLPLSTGLRSQYDNRPDQDYYAQTVGWLKTNRILAPGEKVKDYVIQRQVRLADYLKKKMAHVYQVEKDHQLYLIKDFDLNYTLVHQYYDQERILSQASIHPHFLQALDVFQTEQRGFIVYPLIPGISLEDYLKQEGLISEALAWKILLTVASVSLKLRQYKQPHIHGDIKPGNILIDQDENIFVIDLESTSILEHPQSHTNPAHKPHTFPYSPPEMVFHYQLGPSTDSYGIATTLIQAVTGFFPDLFMDYQTQSFQGWQKRAPSLSQDLKNILQALSVWKPEQRLVLSDALLQTWQKLFEGRRLRAPVPTSQRLARQIQRIAEASEQRNAAELESAGEQVLLLEASHLTYYYLGSQWHQLGNKQKAVEYLLKATRGNAYLQAMWLLGRLWLEEGELAKAQQILIQSLAICQQHYLPYLYLARVYRIQGDFKQAALAYRRALDLSYFLELRIEWLETNLEFGFFETVIGLTQKILQTPAMSPPERSQILHLQGVAFAQQGVHKSAVQCFLEAADLVVLSLKTVPLLCDLGLSYFHLKDWERATLWFQRVLEWDPWAPRALYYLALIAMQAQQWESAEQYLATLEKRRVQLHQVRFQRAIIALQQQRLPLAESLLEQSLAIAPLPEAAALLIKLWREQGQTEKAAALMSQARQWFPEQQAFREQMLKS
ncbi:MAG: protein kinase domain-containing protein [Candidatus Sericytochromatia bacterium]